MPAIFNICSMLEKFWPRNKNLGSNFLNIGSGGRFGHRQSCSSVQKWSSSVRVRHLLKRSEDHWQELDQDLAEVPRLGVRLLLPNCKVARSHTALGHTPILQHPPTGPAHCSLFGNRPIRVMEVLGGFHSLHLTSLRYRHHLLCKIPFLRQSYVRSNS